MAADILIVGAGGRGGTGAFSGGGGAGEVIYIQNYTIPSGIYSIQCGIDSATFTDRQSRIYAVGDLIKANGGGDGGDFLATITTTTNSYIVSKSPYYYFNYEQPFILYQQELMI